MSSYPQRGGLCIRTTSPERSALGSHQPPEQAAPSPAVRSTAPVPSRGIHRSHGCMQGCKRCSVAQGLLLKDKWALVTGASHGIGRAVAEAFAGEGASVILHAHPLNTDGLGKVHPASRGCRAQRSGGGAL